MRTADNHVMLLPVGQPVREVFLVALKKLVIVFRLLGEDQTSFVVLTLVKQ